MPPFVSMPWKAFHPAAPGGEAPGQHGGWLGSAYDSMLLTGDLNLPDWRPQGLGLPADISLDRLSSRVELLRLMDSQRQTLEQASQTSSFHAHQSRALRWVGSEKVREAFDLSRESEANARTLRTQHPWSMRLDGSTISRTRSALGLGELA